MCCLRVANVRGVRVEPVNCIKGKRFLAFETVFSRVHAYCFDTFKPNDISHSNLVLYAVT